MHASKHTHIHTDIHTYVRTYIRIYMHACIRTYLHFYRHPSHPSIHACTDMHSVCLSSFEFILTHISYSASLYPHCYAHMDTDDVWQYAMHTHMCKGMTMLFAWYVCMYAYMCMYVYVHIYIYIYIYIYTYTYIYIYKRWCIDILCAMD